MRDDRFLRILRPSLALAALAALVVLLGLALAGPAEAATVSPEPAATPSGAIVLDQGSEVQFGNDVVVPKGATMPSVVVFGGDILVEGTVTDAVVAFGGDVVINGTVGATTVAFGGDVTLGPEAALGGSLTPADASLVLFGGELTRAPGAEVVGQIQSIDGIDWSAAAGWLARSTFDNPLWGLSFWGWVVQTAFFLVLALVAAALMPVQLRSVQRHLGRTPWASLGWGALVFFIVAPAVLFVLVVSVIGLLLVLPYGLFVLLAYFFATTGVASFLAQKVLTGFGGRENLMLAVTVGVVGTTVVSRIPFAGPVLLTVMMVFGVGAAALGLAEWRRGKREAAAALAAANAAAASAGAYPTAGTAPAQGSIITPIVQTSPAMTPGEASVAPGPAAAEVAGVETSPVAADGVQTVVVATEGPAGTAAETADPPAETSAADSGREAPGGEAGPTPE